MYSVSYIPARVNIIVQKVRNTGLCSIMCYWYINRGGLEAADDTKIIKVLDNSDTGVL